MPDITITITETQKLELDHALLDISEWTANAVTNFARKTGDGIITKLVEHCNANEIALAVGRNAQIQQAYDLGVIQTAAVMLANSEAGRS